MEVPSEAAHVVECLTVNEGIPPDLFGPDDDFFQDNS